MFTRRGGSATNVVPLVTPEATPGKQTLEELLNEMSKYGEVSLRYFKDKTWSCSLDLFVTGAGVSFKIASDYKHPTSMNAAETCHDRLKSALNDVANKTLGLTKG